MKISIALGTLLLPILASAAATEVSLPLTKQQDSTIGNYRDCSYESYYNFGSGDAMKPFQVYHRDERGYYRLTHSVLQKGENGYFVRLYSAAQVEKGMTCPSHVQVLMVR